MHTLLMLSAVALAGAGSLVCNRLLPRARAWDSRRALQVAGLLLPAALFGLLIAVATEFVCEVCFRITPPTDLLLSLSFAGVGVAGLVGAVILNSLRLVMLTRHLRGRTWSAPAWLQAQVAEQANELGLRQPPQVLVAADARPWALAAGFFPPYLIVSSGLVGLLDNEELDAVLCHELMHLRRGDLWWTALAGVLHDLTWFLPTTRRLYRLLRAELELACDDYLVGERRRLALASALARVRLAGLGTGPEARGSLALLDAPLDRSIEARLRRLLDHSGHAAAPGALTALPVFAGGVALVVLLQVGASLWATNMLGCNLGQAGTMNMLGCDLQQLSAIVGLIR